MNKEMKKEFCEMYQKVLEEGKKYKELLQIPLNMETAFEIRDVLDQLNYYAKCCLTMYVKKRQLTDEEKEWLKFKIPDDYVEKEFNKRKYLIIHEFSKKVIIRIKEIYEEVKKEDEENIEVYVQSSISFNDTIVNQS